MSYIRYFPSAPLNAYIEDFYYLDGPAPYPRQKALPVASSNLMINLGESFDVYKPEQPEPFITCSDSWWVGVWNTYHSVDWPPEVKLFGAHFKPGGAYPFLQFPLSELNSQVVPLDAIWGRYTGEIRERLYRATTVQAGFAILEQLLLARLCEAPRGLEVVQCAVTEIAQHHGAQPIPALSDLLGISQNHLGTQFKRLVGVPPKEVARFYRFARVLRWIDSAEQVDLTLIAHQSLFMISRTLTRNLWRLPGIAPQSM